MPHHDTLAVYLPGGEIAPPRNPYGRLVANAGVLRAFARSGEWNRLHVQSLTPAAPEALAEQLQIVAGSPHVTTGPLVSTSVAAAAGTQFYPQAYLTEPAWIRRRDRCDVDYSIVGTMFAFASAEHREQMMQSLLAPVHPWDAVVCSSPTLQRTMSDVLDRWESHLRERLGADVALPRPQLPVIGFGCDIDAQERHGNDAAARASMRADLGVAEHDVVVFYLGRLSYYDKAFPQAMFKVVQEAQRAAGVRVHFVMAGWFAEGDTDRGRFEEAARHYCADVPVHFADGNDPAVVARCWSAADVFLQLSDTILETFGQALVEAMAVGIPLVVSDWDGFRWIVSDGVHGFLVPTLGPAPGVLGEHLALLDQVKAVNYGQYTGAVAQHVAVDVAAATRAMVRLLESPSLRRQMGEAGRRHARERFDWPVVVAAYVALFDDLAARREGASVDTATRLNPLRADPFADFAALPSHVVAGDVVVSRGLWPLPEPTVELDQMFHGMRGTEGEANRVVELLDVRGPMSVADLLAKFPASRRPFVRMTVMWLAKAGTLTWQAP